MIYPLIQKKKDAWIQSGACTVKPIIDYMHQQGKLWDDQFEAIETYLFLKIAAGNKPLAQLFAEGFFFDPINLNEIALSAKARETLENNIVARSLYQFSRLQVNGSTLLPELEKTIAQDEPINYQSIIDAFFYNINYPDYLFSLPMGGGKTFLIAALIYLDLYFARNEPDNPFFAHNFIVLVPSGLKSSILPSLKDIERFDPAWILPEPAATELKRMVRYEVLDQPKSAKKSNRARNPNSQKVNLLASQPNPMGLVFVVNAEKVILDKTTLDDQLHLIELTNDEQARAANELRHMMGRIPNLAIHIDEVHHATSEDIRLRQVVSKWNAQGNVRTVMGYSGTPYLPSPEKILVSEAVQLQFKQITNTVYYYPLVRAIARFLKIPVIKTVANLQPLEIIRRGVEDFKGRYAEKVYQNGTCAKLAIYCGTIDRLEEEIFPFLVQNMGIPPESILKYHKGNKKYKLPKQNETEFASLDLPISRKKIILLVQVGKEGWNCRSLTGVILAQKGDSPTNMVLQTTCRCLRQVDGGVDETALIWLNSDNEKILDKQLHEEQHTSIAEINAIGRTDNLEMMERTSRTEALGIPPIDFYQLKITYETVVVEADLHTEAQLNDMLAKMDTYKVHVVVKERSLTGEVQQTSIIDSLESEGLARFDLWLAEIARESFNTLSLAQMEQNARTLGKIFAAVTVDREGERAFDELFDQEQVRAQIRFAFWTKRRLVTKQEVIPQKAELLLTSKLYAVAKNEKLYPDDTDVQIILKTDITKQTITDLEAEQRKALELLRAQFGTDSTWGNIQLLGLSLAVKSKEHTFHYLPYDFKASGFEKGFLKNCLELDVFQNKKLEIYYNGERGLTEFVIECYAHENGFWKRVGSYTTDFLLIQRGENKAIHKILLVETKGAGFENDKKFIKKKHFVETEFLRLNQERFGYARFDFLFLRDEDPTEENLAKLATSINAFFD
jgi:type III restriction enzyme